MHTRTQDAVHNARWAEALKLSNQILKKQQVATAKALKSLVCILLLS